MYDSVIATYPEAIQDSRFAYHRGLALYSAGRRGEAARAWEELLTAKPPQEIEVFVQFYMGELHREAGRPAEAGRHYRQAQAANPPPELQKALQERLQGR
jgi:tetratricopeptide (TPR) repeat protein